MTKNRHLFLTFILLLTFSLSACFDLGAFDDDEGYEKLFDSFGDVEFLYDGGDESYDYEDSLLNDYTLEHFDWEDSDDKVEQNEYLYIIVPIEDNVTIETIAFFLYSDVAVDIEINFFYFPKDIAKPSNIKYLSSPDTETDPDTGEEVPITYDDPSRSESLLYMKGSLINEEWTSFACEGFRQPGFYDNYLHTEDEGQLYIRIENNSGFNKETLTSVSFSFINFLIRAV